MIAIVAELVVHLRVVGNMRTSHSRPCRASSSTSGTPIRSGEAVRRELVGEGRRMVAKREQHVIRRGRGRRHVLEIVARVRPAAAHGLKLDDVPGVIDDVAVEPWAESRKNGLKPERCWRM